MTEKEEERMQMFFSESTHKPRNIFPSYPRSGMWGNLFCRHAIGAWEGLLKRPMTGHGDKPKNRLFPQEGLSITTASFSAWLSSTDCDGGWGDPENTAIWPFQIPLTQNQGKELSHTLWHSLLLFHVALTQLSRSKSSWFGNYADGKCIMSDTFSNLSGSRVGGAESLTNPSSTHPVFAFSFQTSMKLIFYEPISLYICKC